ncbi:hypothetical protein ACNKHS_21230 [Shigella flexneri]
MGNIERALVGIAVVFSVVFMPMAFMVAAQPARSTASSPSRRSPPRRFQYLWQ